MAMAVISVVGALAGIVSIGMMIPGLIPDKDEHYPVVRIAAGLSTNRADNTAGNMPGVALYDIMGRRVAWIDGTKDILKDGAFIDIKVPFEDGVGTQPSEYIAINNGGDDALCIAYITLTNSDGTKKAWYGDVGKACGADWYHSMLKTGDDDYQPSCIWIDRNRSNGLRFQGLGLHIYDFAATKERAEQFQQNRDLMCKAAPRFRMYENMNSEDYIPYFDPPLEMTEKTLTDKDPNRVMDKATWKMPKEGKNIKKATIDADPKLRVRRDTHSPQVLGNVNATVVIISTSPQHSATELCQSPSSWGHDFVSADENVFCDMEPKTLWPVCDAETNSACFDVTTSTMRAGKGLRGRDSLSGLIPPDKSYGQTIHWN